MSVSVIIALVCMVALAWFWRSRYSRKPPVLKRTTARTWPASRGKLGVKPKLTTSL